jgi:hypothetical protein
MDGSELDQVKIVIRAFNPNNQKEVGLIYATWRNQAFYSAQTKPQLEPKYFFSRVTRTIRDILEHAEVRIACIMDSPDTIIGYSISTGDHLNWIYVKEGYRRKGIGTLLFPKGIHTVTCYMTKDGAKIADKKNLVLKENKHERYH